VVAEEIQKTSNRNDITMFQHGTPNAVLKTASYVPTTHEQTKRMQLEGFKVGHSVATTTAPLHEDKDNHHNSHTNYFNNRAVNQQPHTFGTGFTSAIGAVIAPIMDMLKPSKKEEYSCNMRVYGNIGGEVPGNYIFTSGDTPNTTVKETTIYQPNSHIGNQNDNAAYLVTDQQPITNQRDTLNHEQLMGMSSNHGNRQYDSAYRQTNSESKEKSIAGRTNSGNSKHFNSQINVTMSKLDADRENNRLWEPQATIRNGPSAQTHGKPNMPQYYNDTQGCDRINPDILDSIKNNPYVFSFNSVA